jgi:hypothetical protein
MNRDSLLEILAAIFLGLFLACTAASIVLLTHGPP